MGKWVGLAAVLFVLVTGCMEEGVETPEGIPGIGKKEPEPPRIGDVAPSFEAEATTGPIKFPDDYAGRWVVLFSHPADFTPVCTTEFMRLSAAAGDFAKINCDLVGLSTDTLENHQTWLLEMRRIKLGKLRDVRIRFPVVADDTLEIAKKYGMIHPKSVRKQTVRTVFVVDPKGVIRATIAYPPEVGRSIGEIRRLVLALQTSDHFEVATPANWEAGKSVILKPLPTPEENKARARRASTDYQALAWFLCMKPLPDPEKALRKVDWAAVAAAEEGGGEGE